jgi:large subunit ribosomal protein L13
MQKISRQIKVIDAAGQSVGRLASVIAILLRGKHKTDYLPYIDNGDIVRVVNADEIKFSGKKYSQKKYYNYSGYPGGLKSRDIKNLKPDQILKKAVKDMLPPNKLRVNMLKRLTIYTRSADAQGKK